MEATWKQVVGAPCFGSTVRGRLPATSLPLADKECGSMAKGHNWGLCRKCGKEHIHGAKRDPQLFKRIAREMGKANKGKPSKLKGHSSPLKGKKKSPEHYAKIVAINKSPEKRRRISQKLTGRRSPMKGKHLTPIQRLRKCLAMRNSVKFHDAIEKRDEKRVRKFLISLYGFSEEEIFFPASKYEHKFARFVLIEGRHSFGFVHCRLQEQFPNEFAVMVRK